MKTNSSLSGFVDPLGNRSLSSEFKIDKKLRSLHWIKVDKEFYLSKPSYGVSQGIKVPRTSI
jgi:hypothetical protein